MVTGLPEDRAPGAEPDRCYCRRFLLVFTGEMDCQAGEAKRTAEEMGTIFVNARRTPFFQGKCGQILDFVPDCSTMIQ